IRYSLPQEARGEKQEVSLIVYDILGNKVTTLVNEQKEAGYYEIEFNASQYASGVYIYRLQAGSFVSTKKMMVIK
uniref:T9SS type A sorting domain-containing protein n=1 Tax=Ignavibacterium sp. TaxID=2651167 RepID=UPI00307EDA43